MQRPDVSWWYVEFQRVVLGWIFCPKCFSKVPRYCHILFYCKCCKAMAYVTHLQKPQKNLPFLENGATMKTFRKSGYICSAICQQNWKNGTFCPSTISWKFPSGGKLILRLFFCKHSRAVLDINLSLEDFLSQCLFPHSYPKVCWVTLRSRIITRQAICFLFDKGLRGPRGRFVRPTTIFANLQIINIYVI